MNYRPDIDGLRAVAVLAVVLFHGKVELLSGGYAGVDVFFVISGFLITSIILSKWEAGKFSLMDFYIRRVRRLLPALLVMLLFSLIGGYVILFPGDFKAMAESVLAAVFSVSYIYFWQDAGYFSQASDLKPVLHTWSLGVEEHFYLFYPVLLLGFVKTIKRGRGVAMGVVVLACFAFSFWATRKMPSAAFYLLPMRAWELLLGALCVWFPSRLAARPQLSNALAAVGLIMILASIVFMDKHAEFPGRDALVPCLGAALVLIFAAKSLVGRWLSNRLFTFVGKASYSIYLWHWPVVSFMHHMADDLTPSLLAAYFVLSFVLGGLSWQFVEQPFRFRGAGMSKRKVVCITLAGMGIVSSLAGVVVVKQGVSGRFDPAVESLITAAYEPYDVPDIRRVSEAVVRGRDGVKPRFALWGDSHVRALGGVVSTLAAEYEEAVVIYSRSSTPPILNIRRTGYVDITGYNQNVFDDLRAREIEIVFLHALWSSSYTGGFVGLQSDGSFGTGAAAEISDAIADTVEQLGAAGFEVVIVCPVPIPGMDVPRDLARSVWRGANLDELSVPSRYAEFNAPFLNAVGALADMEHVSVIETHDLFAKAGDTVLQIDGEALYRDTDHLSETGAQLLYPRLKQVFDAYANDRESN